MTEDFFMRLCDVYGFAPSRALRELVDAAIGQAVVTERHACAAFLERAVDLNGLAEHPAWQKYTADLLTGCASAIRARSTP